MTTTEKKETTQDLGMLSIPNAMLEAAGISADSDLTVETVPGVLLIGQTEPLLRVNQPFLELFKQLGFEQEEVVQALERGSF